jgi:hypothetical protein
MQGSELPDFVYFDIMAAMDWNRSTVFLSASSARYKSV